MAMVDSGSDTNERALQAELLFRQAVSHCERGEWEAALSLVEKALELEKRVAFMERRALILERLCRLEDAMLARRQATALAEQVRVSHLEEVLEFRAEGHRAIEKLLVEVSPATQFESRAPQRDYAMVDSVPDSLQIRSSFDDLMGTYGHRVRVTPRATVRRSAVSGAARHATAPRAQKTSRLKRTWNALLRRLRLQR